MPAPEEIALLEPFARLGLDRITLVRTAAEAEDAARILLAAPALGFDTESKPTFEAGVASDGPHVVQLATLEQAFIFQLHDPGCRSATAELVADTAVLKAGFGLRDDKKRIVQKFGVEPRNVLDLDTVFRQRGYRKQMGVKAAVAVLFGKRYLKSKRAATSNWARGQLTESQLLYAANDAWAAACVYHALGCPALETNA
jgi:ribonuclease D